MSETLHSTWIILVILTSFVPGIGVVADSIINSICVMCCFSVYNNWYNKLCVCCTKCCYSCWMYCLVGDQPVEFGTRESSIFGGLSMKRWKSNVTYLRKTISRDNLSKSSSDQENKKEEDDTFWLESTEN